MSGEYYSFICRSCTIAFLSHEVESDAWADGVNHYNHTWHLGDVKMFDGNGEVAGELWQPDPPYEYLHIYQQHQYQQEHHHEHHHQTHHHEAHHHEGHHHQHAAEPHEF